ncbi:MAG: hypothetical protein CM15mP104_4390 [Gammaproteobacteria bacterium]|nr:MAG: hypothetical protein CM15mP104_4390 [Gammaproteobacteria bacterium]
MNNIQINDFEIGNTLPLTIIGGVNVLESDQLCSEVANTFVDLSKNIHLTLYLKDHSIKQIDLRINLFVAQALLKGCICLKR